MHVYVHECVCMRVCAHVCAQTAHISHSSYSSIHQYMKVNNNQYTPGGGGGGLSLTLTEIRNRVRQADDVGAVCDALAHACDLLIFSKGECMCVNGVMR